MKAKYVMTTLGPVIFPGSFQHSDFSNLKPVSAGFVIFDDNGKPTTYGRSESLGMKSRPGDSRLIEIFFEIGK